MAAQKRISNQFEEVNEKHNKAVKLLHQRCDQIIQDHSKSIDNLVKSEQLEAIYKKFPQFASHEELKKHKDRVEPLCKTTIAEQNKFKLEHTQMKEMIRRFDELLADKTNKISLIELEERVSKNYLSQKQWGQLQEQFRVMNEEVLAQLENNKEFIAKQEEKLDAIVLQKVQDKLDFML